MTLKNQKKIIFLHIPKTAGSTFRTFIASLNNQDKFNHFHSGGKGYIPQFHPDYFNSLKNSRLSKPLEIFSGHFVFSKHCIKSDLYTFIRDIHKAFFSNFYFFYLKIYKVENKNVENINYIKNKIKLDISISLNDISIIKNLFENNFLNSDPITKVFAGVPFKKYFLVKDDFKINDQIYQIALKNTKYFKGIIDNKNIKKFFYNFLNQYNFKVRNFNSQNIANYDRNFINLISNKLHDEILEYNKYDNMLIQEIKKLSSYY